MNSKIIKNLIFLLLILFNLINKSLTNENHYPIFWIILDENGHYVDVLNCSEGIFNNGFPAEENKASTSYSAPQYSSDSASYYDFTQNGKMDWDYIYVELKILRKELIQYKEYDGDEVDELIYHMNLLENELKETIINKLGLENLIINLNL
uniref:Uncharacterized protein n=1 Tax=Meloidogyne hapla TaxID=6305 RepID=A0A1I8B455_MELHA